MMLMAQMGRPGLSVSQKAEMWRRWKNGESHSDIGRALGKQAASIHGSIRIRGGIAPLPRTRSARALSSEEREEISRGVAAGTPMRAIAVSIGRAASTVSREIDRNGGLNKYRANIADEAAWKRARRPKSCRLAVVPRLRRVVTAKLRMNWSPEQVSGWLKREYPDDETMHISHETDLSHALHPGARGAQEGAGCTSSDEKNDAPFKEINHSRSAKRADRWGGVDQRTTCRDRRPISPWTLGRRFDLGLNEHTHRYVGRETVALYHARQARRQGHRDRRKRSDQASSKAPV